MIQYKELREIDNKLSILIWINVVIISAIFITAIFVIVYEVYWTFAILIPVLLIHISVSYWLHIKLKKHTKLQ
jgi:hypothetical protein